MVQYIILIEWVFCTALLTWIRCSQKYSVHTTERTCSLYGKIRKNSLKLLHFDSRDEQIIQESFQQVLAFSAGLQLLYGLTDNDIMSALRAAHIAADEYYTVRHVLAWNTDFDIPVEAIEADLNLFNCCNY